jgi:AraC-like DNA-binding protein
VRGKKVMHLPGRPAFDYLPGQTVIVPGNETMAIDFPEATMDNPTQCIALAVDGNYINDSIGYLNQYYNNHRTAEHEWKLQLNQYHFDNDTEVTGLINKLIRVCSSGDPAKNIFADLSLKELLIRLLQSQHLQQISAESQQQSNHSQLHYLLDYVRQNISEKILIDNLCRRSYLSRNAFFKLFREQFGVTPLEFINHERLKLAKKLLAESEDSLHTVSSRCGFSDVNYFVRLFRKKEGLTPGVYKHLVQKPH